MFFVNEKCFVCLYGYKGEEKDNEREGKLSPPPPHPPNSLSLLLFLFYFSAPHSPP